MTVGEVSMQVSVESGQGLEKRMLVDLPAEQVTEAVEKKLQSYARNVRMDGFRPGKVPMKVVRQRYGEQAKQEAYGDLIQLTFYEAANQQGLKLAGQPQIEMRDEHADGSFGYTATFEVMPEVAVTGLGDMQVSKPVSEVTEEDVDMMIDNLRKQRTDWQEVDRAAQDGDTANVDFTGYMDGEAFPGGNANDVPVILGSDSMIPGFEEALVGAKAGDERKFDVTFPEDYRAEHLAGKPATFEAKVLKVSEPVVPELDEEFVKSFGVEDGNVDTLRAEIRGNMERELKQKLVSLTKERVMDALLAVNPVEVPKAMVDEEAERIKAQTQSEMANAGQSSNLDLPLDMFTEQAKRRVILGLLLGSVMREQNLELDQDRVNATIEEFAASYENPAELVEWYAKNPQQRRQVENLVLEEQVVDWLLSQANVTEEPMSFAGVVGNQV
jgi:trigger factor